MFYDKMLAEMENKVRLALIGMSHLMDRLFAGRRFEKNCVVFYADPAIGRGTGNFSRNSPRPRAIRNHDEKA